MLDLATAYAETQQHLAELVRNAPPEQPGWLVPASPAWTVKDVVAHVTGVAGDVAEGRLAPELDLLLALGDPEQADRRDAVTATQVAVRKDLSVDEILNEWFGHVEALLPMIRGERPFPQPRPLLDGIVVTDLATHAQDVRGAVDQPGDRDSAGVSAAFVGYSRAAALRLAARGVRPLRLRYQDKERMIGEGEPGATLSGDRFELFRALAGRRSRDQILAMDWEGDPAPYVDLIPAYGPRSDAILE
jgi:uncharacterized protein (TIGR03083 family)